MKWINRGGQKSISNWNCFCNWLLCSDHPKQKHSIILMVLSWWIWSRGIKLHNGNYLRDRSTFPIKPSWVFWWWWIRETSVSNISNDSFLLLKRKETFILQLHYLSLQRKKGSCWFVVEPILKEACSQVYPRAQFAFKDLMIHGFCNSHYISHFAAFFIVTWPKISIAKSCS